MSMIGTLRRLPDRRLKALRAEPNTVHDFFEEEVEASHVLDLDKHWHGLHFLLTGTAWKGTPPLDFLVRGGRELDTDMGYGPPRSLSNKKTHNIARALDPLTREILSMRYKPKAMAAAEIYPAVWGRAEEADDNRESLLRSFEELKAFVTTAAEAGDGLIVYIS